MNLIDMIRDAAAANGRTLDDVMQGANVACFQSDMGADRVAVYGDKWAVYADVSATPGVYFSAGIDAPVSAIGPVVVIMDLSDVFAPLRIPAPDGHIARSFDDRETLDLRYKIDVAVPADLAHRLEGFYYSTAQFDPYEDLRDIQDVVLIRDSAQPGQKDCKWDHLSDY